MHHGRSKDHFLSQRVYRRNINRCLCHPVDERTEIEETEPWEAEDDYFEEDWLTIADEERLRANTCEECGQEYSICTCYESWDDDQYYYDEWDDDRYDDAWYEEDGSIAPPARTNLTRPGSDWDF